MNSEMERRLGGVVLVDKPEGPTSHDIVLWARRSLDISRVGHAGTLDPFASGLLLIMTGWATRISQYLTDLPKVYDATIRLGMSTDTDDVTGAVTKEDENWNQLTTVEIKESLKAFEGLISQKPPQYSAKKVRGEPMYRKARRGERVDLNSVSVEVSNVTVNEVSLPFVSATIRCSSGTYIRSLARDLGEMLGVGAHLTALRRLSIGSFSVDQSLCALALREGQRPGGDNTIEIKDALSHMEFLNVGEDVALKLRNGVPVNVTERKHGEGEMVLISSEGKLVGIHEISKGLMRPKKIVPMDLVG